MEGLTEISVNKSMTAAHCKEMGPTGMGHMHIMRIESQWNIRSDPFAIFQPLIIRTTLDITHVRVPGLSFGNYHVRDTFFFVVRGVDWQTDSRRHSRLSELPRLPVHIREDFIMPSARSRLI